MSREQRRNLAARLGLFAALFQAILFGWHHHDLVFPQHLPAAVVENPAASPQPADDEDGCEICQVLHNQAVASVDFAVAPPSLNVTAAPAFGTARAG